MYFKDFLLNEHHHERGLLATRANFLRGFLRNVLGLQVMEARAHGAQIPTVYPIRQDLEVKNAPPFYKLQRQDHAQPLRLPPVDARLGLPTGVPLPITLPRTLSAPEFSRVLAHHRARSGSAVAA